MGDAARRGPSGRAVEAAGRRIARALAAAAIGVVALGAAACGRGGGAADLVLLHGKIVTVDSARPEAEALAVRGDTIVAVGSDAEIGRLVGPDTRTIDLAGRLAVPGFIDSHAHFMGMGRALTELDLMHTSTWSEIVDSVAAEAGRRRPGSWILGRGWHQEKWSEPFSPSVRGFPTREALDRAAPDNPVYLVHASGHAAIANGAALRAAGIGRDTPDPEGGTIVRDARGRATGVLLDNAEGLVAAALDSARSGRTPEEVRAERERQVDLAARDALSKGITSLQDQGESLATIDFLEDLAERGKLPLRLYVLVSQGEATAANDSALRAHRMIDHAGGHLTVRAIGEVTADGALGSHSAWFLEPYADQPDNTGLEVTSPERIAEIGRIALRDDFQVAVHAIGDRANRETLDTFAALFDSIGGGADLRWRIEHAQHLSPQDIPRFARLGVIASMQGIHACSDGPYVVQRLGEKRAREGAYAWKKLWGTGAVVTNGTDAPVEDVDPLPSFACTVSRKLADGSLFFPDEALTRAQALRTYTLNGAYAAFEEDEKGSLTPGKLADIAVLSRDIMTIPVDSIASTRVDYTIVGGNVEYAADASGG
ncbi:MAG TPA: amidohydrolase [Gemmatimonadota bacterium]|nr:amidohydrolase [Gemmatimonadota bacterium]